MSSGDNIINSLDSSTSSSINVNPSSYYSILYHIEETCFVEAVIFDNVKKVFLWSSIFTHTSSRIILAARAVGGLEKSGSVKSVLSGRRDDLLASMKRAGGDYSLNLPIASRPKQVESINSFAISINGKDGLFSLGGIHHSL